MKKICVVCFALLSLCLSTFSFGFSGEVDIDIGFNGQTMFADLQEVSLGLILKEIRRERGIWFQGSESVLDTKVSFRSKGLSVEEGLKRILSKVSYILFFDQQQRIVGLSIVDKNTPTGSFPRTKIMTRREPASSPSGTKAARFPTAKRLSSHQGKTSTGISREKEPFRRSQIDSSDLSINKKLTASREKGQQSIPDRITLFSKPIEDIKTGTNPFGLH